MMSDIHVERDSRGRIKSNEETEDCLGRKRNGFNLINPTSGYVVVTSHPTVILEQSPEGLNGSRYDGRGSATATPKAYGAGSPTAPAWRGRKVNHDDHLAL